MAKSNGRVRQGRSGYMPLVGDHRGGIAWQGERLPDFWMWSGQHVKGEEGPVRHTVRVASVAEAAMRIWRDGWRPVEPLDEDTVMRMEEALRRHRGLKAQGVKFPEGRFLDPRAAADESASPKERTKADKEGRK